MEIVEHGAGIIADADPKRIIDAYDRLVETVPVFPPLFGNAHAAESIIKTIIEYIG